MTAPALPAPLPMRIKLAHGLGSVTLGIKEAGLTTFFMLYYNQVLGMVYQWQTSFYNKHYFSTVAERKTDYVKVAEGFGAKGFRAETKAEFERVLKEALATGKPCWIVCPIDRNERVLPMIAGGETVRAAITE